jgi:hypothetical protein
MAKLQEHHRSFNKFEVVLVPTMSQALYERRYDFHINGRRINGRRRKLKSSKELRAELHEIQLRINQESWNEEVKTLGLISVVIDELVALELTTFIQARSWKRIAITACIGPGANLVVAHAMSRSRSLRLEHKSFADHRNYISFSQLGTQLGSCTLKRLVLIGFSWTPEMLTALGIGLSSNTTLETLNLSFARRLENTDNDNIVSLRPLAQGLRDARSLRSLVFNNSRLDDAQLAELIGSLTLKRLVLAGFSWTPEMLAALGIGLSSNITLLELDLSFARRLENTDNENIVSLQPLAQGLRDATSLRSLVFHNSRLDDAHLAELIGALRDHPSLRSLNLNGNNCQSQGTLQVATMLQSLYSKLRCLRLGAQHDPHDHGEYSHIDIGPLASALRTNQTLEFLDLAYNTPLRPERLHAPNDHSEYIRLDIALLASALRTNQTLVFLNLSYNRLTDSDMTTLGPALRANNVLRCLYLDDTRRNANSFGPNGAKELLESMQHNLSIECLSIPTESGLEMKALQRKINFLANRNRAGRRLLSQENNIPGALWALLVERINTTFWGERNKRVVCPCLLATKDAETERASILFCLLRDAPVLFERPCHKRSNYSGEAMDETKLAALKKQRIAEIP